MTSMAPRQICEACRLTPGKIPTRSLRSARAKLSRRQCLSSLNLESGQANDVTPDSSKPVKRARDVRSGKVGTLVTRPMVQLDTFVSVL